MQRWEKILLYRKKIFEPYIYIFDRGLDMATIAISIIFMLGLMLQYGFSLSAHNVAALAAIYNITWILFLINATYALFTGFRKVKAKHKKLIIALNILLYLSVLPHIFFRPEMSRALAFVWDVLHSHLYKTALLTLYAIFVLSSGVVKLMGKRTNPSLILAISFFAIILIGTVLLIMPKSTVHGISLVDALFVSTSAVCVTGLTPVEVAGTFTIEGQIIIILLIQIGGLGVMTLTSFFAVFFMGNTSVYNQMVVKDMINSDSLNSLISTLVYILGFTLAIEGTGMIFIWISIHGTLGMNLHQELFFSAFHSISAFCNAGFSTLPGNLGNPLVMQHHNMLYLVVSFLIILGGIGFPILVNFKDILLRKRTYRLLNLNTRLVLYTTFVLLVSGTALLAIFEWNGAFKGMSFSGKLVQSFFNAVCPRTAGFTSVDLTALSIQSILIYTVLMWIGGAAQSTAGGIKVNAFAVAVLNMKTVLRNSQTVEAFRRKISADSIRRSNATIMLSIGVLFVFIFVLTLTEPHIPPLKLVFESVSALSTVGSSLNTTPLLSDAGKVLIALLMFMGRVGLITFLLGVITPKKNTKYSYPSDHIIIN